MIDVALRVAGLGKQYKIGRRQKKYRTFRDMVTEMLMTPFIALLSCGVIHLRRWPT